MDLRLRVELTVFDTLNEGVPLVVRVELSGTRLGVPNSDAFGLDRDSDALRAATAPARLNEIFSFGRELERFFVAWHIPPAFLHLGAKSCLVSLIPKQGKQVLDLL